MIHEHPLIGGKPFNDKVNFGEGIGVKNLTQYCLDSKRTSDSFFNFLCNFWHTSCKEFHIFHLKFPDLLELVLLDNSDIH